MDNKINLSQLTELFCEVSGLGKGVSTAFVKSFFETITKDVSAGGQVRIKGFGSFKQILISDRESVNVNTGERIVIHGHQKISFTPDSELKAFINKPFNSFETVIVDAPVQVTREKSVTTEQETLAVDNPEPDISANDKKSKPKPVRRFRSLLTVCIILLTVLIISYCVWPLNIIHTMRKGMESMESGTDNAELSVKSVDIVRLADTVAIQAVADDIEKSESTVQLESIPQEKPAKAPQEEQPATPQSETASRTSGSKILESKLILTDSDIAKPLEQFTICDTTSYRMTDVILAMHVLKSGETLTKISQQYYGTKKLWPYIAAYNKIKDANSTSVGMNLNIPVLTRK